MRSAFLAPVVALLAIPACRKKVPITPPPPVIRAPAPEPPPAPPPPPATPQRFDRLQRIGFDFDSAALGSDSRRALDANSEILRSHPDVKIEIQGHCDERGTTEYNLALGQKRADAAMRYLVNQGISPSRINVVSYGEERPLEPGHDEAAWERNRRGEFVITWGADDSIGGSAAR